MQNNIKIKKHYKNGYTTIDNILINDMSLSFKAKGVFLYFWSKPDDWEIKPKAIGDDWKDGETIIYTALKELEDKGYLYRKRFYINSKVAGIDYHLSDIREFNQELLNQENLDEGKIDEYIYIQNKESNKIKNQDTTKNAVVQKQEQYLSLPEWQELSGYETERVIRYITQRKEDHGKTIKNTSKAIKPILSAILELKVKGLSIDDIMENIKDKNGCVYQTIRIGYFDNVFSRLKAQNNPNSYKNGNSYQQTETYTPKQPLNDDKNSKDYFSYRFNEDISVAFGYQECIELTNSIIEQKPEFEKIARTKALLEWLKNETESQYNTKIKSEVLDIYKKGGYSVFVSKAIEDNPKSPWKGLLDLLNN